MRSKHSESYIQSRRCLTDALQSLQRVARELRIWNRMRHENILSLLGLWENFAVGDMQIVQYSVPVSPYFEDGDLRQYIKNHDVSLFERLSFVGLCVLGH